MQAELFEVLENHTKPNARLESLGIHEIPQVCWQDFQRAEADRYVQKCYVMTQNDPKMLSSDCG
jgi:hypothetical protein